MVFELELEDDETTHRQRRDSGSPNDNGLPDTLSPLQRAWLLKNLDLKNDNEGVQDSTKAGTEARPSQSSKMPMAGEGHDTETSREDTRYNEKSRDEEDTESKNGIKDNGLNLNSFSACLCCYP
jgi:hypothetical protein